MSEYDYGAGTEGVMTRCPKCTGLLAQQYDVNLRESEWLCINCGCRPAACTTLLTAEEKAPLCRQCRTNPCSDNLSWRGGETRVDLCLECRIVNARKRRASREVKGGGKVAVMLMQKILDRR